MINKAVQPWLDDLPGFHIFGELYHVGGRISPSYLLDTGDGLLLLDTGLPKSVFIFRNISELGFDPRDVRWIIHSHGHIDHIGLTRMFMEMNHAESYIGEADRDLVNGNAEELLWTREFDMRYEEPFEPDHLLHDGDILHFGRLKIKCVATPGHTMGVMSFFLDLTENGRTLRAGSFGGAGHNTLALKYLRKYGLPESRRELFLENFPRLRREKVELFFGNHLGNYNALEKARLKAAGAAENPFIDPDEWLCFLDSTEKKIKDFFASGV